MLTVIIASFNEIHNPVFWLNLSILREFPAFEILLVDGGSTDTTLERLKEFAAPKILPGSRRGERYNWGIEHSKGTKILLLHPRSLISRSGLEMLSQLEQTTTWGAFRHSFDVKHPLLNFTSWYSNYVRGRRGIFYLDHCLFLTADLKPYARFPVTSIFEDTYFCYGLRAVARPLLLSEKVVTSAIRFQRNGVWQQSVLNQVLKILFYLRVSEFWMNRIYERGLGLNDRANQ